MVPSPGVAGAEAGGLWVWRTRAEWLGRGLWRGVEEEARVLSLFPYSSSEDWDLSTFLLLPCPLQTKLRMQSPQ